MSNKKTGHGGKREGAGRPSEAGEPTVMLCCRVPKSVAERLDTARADKSRSQVFRDSLDLWLKRHG